MGCCLVKNWFIVVMDLDYLSLQLVKWASILGLPCWFEKSWPHLGQTVVSLNMVISLLLYPRSFSSISTTNVVVCFVWAFIVHSP